MKSKSLTLFLVALATFPPALASAGEFRGTLTKNGAPVPNAKIEIAPGKHQATTDSSGFYRVFVPETGSCTLTVTHNEALSVVAMRVHSPDCSPVGINRRNAAPTATGFAEIVSDDFPVLHAQRIHSCFSSQSF
jgi:Carboxypeptidase regulatory-like domain